MGMIFENVMAKTDLPYNTASDLRPAGDPSPAIDDFKTLRTGDIWFYFRHNVFKNLSPGPKYSLERRATLFSTICAKNQAPNKKIDEVTTL